MRRNRIALLCRPTRVIHVIAVLTARGKNMIAANTEQTENIQTVAEQAKGSKKAGVSARGGDSAPAKGKPGKKAPPAKKAPKGKKKPEKLGARQGSKTA